ncbi:C4-dicarboxylate transporter/malic acid transport protein [Corynebacterium ciconiae DSM 44920]|nr:C4-dicarboxylate transporter/malic acid transport protein [Corynebacterium ciconiae DSM 44920]
MPSARILRSQRNLMVPGPGPAWFGAVMGTGILSNLLITVGDQRVLGAGMLVLGWLMLVGLTIGFFGRSSRDRAVLLSSITDIGQCTGWGMVAMGYLSVGAATPVVLGAWNAPAGVMDTAWTVDLVMWLIGASIGIVGAFGMGYVIIGKRLPEPRPVWGLPIVAPMVAATTGASQVPQMASTSAAVWLLMASTACFFIALVLASIIFLLSYMHAWRRSPLPPAALTSAWIPLGIIGQSSAAAQVIARQAAAMAQPEVQSSILRIADVYGLVMMVLGIPMLLAAFYLSYSGFLTGMPVHPGWWALTFPVGTLALGTHFLGLHMPLFDALSHAFLMLLCAHWLIAAYGSVRSIAAVRRRGDGAQA